MPTILRVCPERYVSTEAVGVPVRAQHDDGTFSAVDIAELDAPSLLAFIRSRGGSNEYAESLVFHLLGWSPDDFHRAQAAAKPADLFVIEHLTGNMMAAELVARFEGFKGAPPLLRERLGEAGSAFAGAPPDVLEDLAHGRRKLVYQPCTVTAAVVEAS